VSCGSAAATHTQQLKHGDAVEARFRRNCFDLAQINKSPILLNAENTDRAVSGIQRVQELAIRTNCDIEVAATGWIYSHDCCANWG